MISEVFAFPHSAAEFPSTEKLREFLSRALIDRQGIYRVVTANRYKRLGPADLVLFHKNGEIVGQGRVSQGLRLYDPPERVPGQVYEGFVKFDPNSLIVYSASVPLPPKINRRTVQRISQRDYERLMA